jgi:hypothetical protein
MVLQCKGSIVGFEFDTADYVSIGLDEDDEILHGVSPLTLSNIIPMLHDDNCFIVMQRVQQHPAMMAIV